MWITLVHLCKQNILILQNYVTISYPFAIFMSFVLIPRNVCIPKNNKIQNYVVVNSQIPIYCCERYFLTFMRCSIKIKNLRNRHFPIVWLNYLFPFRILYFTKNIASIFVTAISNIKNISPFCSLLLSALCCFCHLFQLFFAKPIFM